MRRASTICGILAFVFPLAIFAASAAHEPSSWDTAEAQGVPYILGIAHPTGFPLYVLAGYAFSHAFATGTIAFRLNLFSSLCAAAACFAAFAAAVECGVPLLAALLASWWLAVTNGAWLVGRRADVHDLAFALSAFTALLCIRWMLHARPQSLRLAALCFGLGLATHPIVGWLLPGIVFCVAAGRARPRIALVAQCAALTITCLALYAYLPWRSNVVSSAHLDPAHILRNGGGLFWNYDDPRLVQGFLAEVTGSQFAAPASIASAWDVRAIGSHLLEWSAFVERQMGVAGAVLALLGALALLRRNWKLALAIVILGWAAVPFSYAYWAVVDPDRYRLLSLWMVATFVAAAALPFGSSAGVRGFLAAGLIATFGGWTLWNNEANFDNRFSTGGRPLLTEIAVRVPRNASVVAPWFDATTLAYGAYVDGTFAGRRIVSAWPAERLGDYRAWQRYGPVYIVAPSQADLSRLPFKRLYLLDPGHILYVVP